MTPTEVTTILRQFNEWLRGDYEPSEQPDPPDLRAKVAEMEQQEPVAWCATDETGTVVEALGMNQSRRFDTALGFLPRAKGEEK